MKCIVCKCEIVEAHYLGHPHYLGIVKDVKPVYGSSHDMRQIRIGVCDDCITDAEDNNIIEIIKENVSPFE